MKGKSREKFYRAGQKLLALLALTAALIAFSSCATTKGDPLAYRNFPLSAEVAGRLIRPSGDAVSFSATVELSALSDGARGFLLTFRAPDSLSGLSVRRSDDGGVTLARDGMEILLPDGDAVSGFIKIAEMLDPIGEIVGISSISGSSVGLFGFSYLTLIEMPLERIYLDPHTSYPVRVEFSDGETDIIFDAVTCRT